MVNYDLPWNPNRLEQRFGRIHRIGQTEVCHLWNMVASETREGDVFQRLFEKLERQRDTLGGRVFDILGEAFENVSLKDLLIEAIRYGERPDIKAKLSQAIEGALDTEHLKGIMTRNALCEQQMSLEELYAVKEEMEQALIAVLIRAPEPTHRGDPDHLRDRDKADNDGTKQQPTALPRKAASKGF